MQVKHKPLLPSWDHWLPAHSGTGGLWPLPITIPTWQRPAAERRRAGSLSARNKQAESSAAWPWFTQADLKPLAETAKPWGLASFQDL